jgi:hypothetical protein
MFWRVPGHSSGQQGVAGGQDDYRKRAGDLKVCQRPLAASIREDCLDLRYQNFWRFIKEFSFCRDT